MVHLVLLYYLRISFTVQGRLVAVGICSFVVVFVLAFMAATIIASTDFVLTMMVRILRAQKKGKIKKTARDDLR